LARGLGLADFANAAQRLRETGRPIVPAVFGTGHRSELIDRRRLAGVPVTVPLQIEKAVLSRRTGAITDRGVLEVPVDRESDPAPEVLEGLIKL
jgi:hypothetical protein